MIISIDILLYRIVYFFEVSANIVSLGISYRIVTNHLIYTPYCEIILSFFKGDGFDFWMLKMLNIYAFGRCFHPKRLALHSRYAFYRFMHSLRSEPMNLAFPAPCLSYKILYKSEKHACLLKYLHKAHHLWISINQMS